MYSCRRSTHMNYIKIYINLMRKSKKRELLTGYFERHHVFPVSIYGKNDNIVFLTAKEHYIAHYLLFKMCKKRYGIFHYRTKKMHFAFNQMTWCAKNQKRYTSKTFVYARMASSVYCTGKNNPAKTKESRAKISQSKLGKVRLDMIGKRYFGASEESIKNGIEIMRSKKIGKSTNYPKTRKSSPRSGDIAKKISESRLNTLKKYVTMTDEEFLFWIKRHKLYRKDGKKNSNITRAITARNELLEKYYESETI